MTIDRPSPPLARDKDARSQRRGMLLSLPGSAIYVSFGGAKLGHFLLIGLLQ